MGNKKKWTRTALKKEICEHFKFKVETQKHPVVINSFFNLENLKVLEISDLKIKIYGDIKIEIPIYLIESLRVLKNDENLIFRIFLKRNQYFETDLKIIK